MTWDRTNEALQIGRRATEEYANCNTPIFLGCHGKLENERVWRKRIIIENVLKQTFHLICEDT